MGECRKKEEEEMEKSQGCLPACMSDEYRVSTKRVIKTPACNEWNCSLASIRHTVFPHARTHRQTDVSSQPTKYGRNWSLRSIYAQMLVLKHNFSFTYRLCTFRSQTPFIYYSYVRARYLSSSGNHPSIHPSIQIDTHSLTHSLLSTAGGGGERIYEYVPTYSVGVPW